MPSVSLENPNEVFEDGENPPSSRSSESGFTEFVQYQADTTDDIDRALNEGHSAPGIPIIGSTSSETETASTVGSEETIVQPPSMMTQGTATRSGKTIQKTAMQCCLEYVQQFLTRFINLYIIQSNSLSQPLGAELPVDPTREQEQTTKWDRESQVDAKVKKTNKKKTPKEYLPAFIAACQLYLECSSFPVYIAEGNRTSELHPGKPEVGKLHSSLLFAFKILIFFSHKKIISNCVHSLCVLLFAVALRNGSFLLYQLVCFLETKLLPHRF